MSKSTIFKSILVVFLVLFTTNIFAKDENKSKPNILFIEVDDLNYEYLSCMGSTLIKTPNVDKLAKSGVLFQNAVCQGMMCGPSRNSLISGLYPHNMGFYRNGQMKSLPENVWTLPKGMQKSGYYTAWIGKCHIRPFGKDKNEAMSSQMGFDFVKQTAGRAVLSSTLKKGITKSDDWYFNHMKSKGLLEQFGAESGKISTLNEDDYLDGLFSRTAINFIEGYDKEEPFFLWLNYSVPHGPYDVAAKYHEPFDAENMPGTTTPKYEVPDMLVKDTKYVDDEEFHKEHQTGNCANTAFMDAQVGRIIDVLQKKNILENTIVVFFSDHGVMMGDHKRIHKGTLYRQITNPALIVSYPAEFQQNKVVNEPVELMDLIRTSLEIADAPESELAQRELSQSLLPTLRKGKKVKRKVAFGEVEGYVMATDGRYRLIKGEDTTLLFDDLNDPKNLTDISSNNPEKVKQLSYDIKDWFQKTGPALPKNSH